MIDYFQRIWGLRYFWTALIRNDIRNRYRGSVIGIGWSMLHPLLMTAVICIFLGGYFNMEKKAYAPYLLCGLVFWNFLSACMREGCHSFYNNESYIRQHPAPMAIYPLRITLSSGFHFLAGMGIVLCAAWVTEGFGNLPVLISLIPTLAMIFIFCWSLAIILGILNVLFQDCQHLIEVVLQILFYATPIMYRPEILDGRKIGFLMQFNPLAHLLNMLREPILYGRFPTVGMTLCALAVVAGAVGIAMFAMAKFERRIIFYL